MDIELFSNAGWLNVDQNNSYGPAPIPSPRDAEIESLIVKWQTFSPSERNEAAARIIEEQRLTFFAFAERMATSAVRQQDPNRIYLGLLAVGIDGWKTDWHDNAAILCLHYNAAIRLGIDPYHIFHKAGSILSEKVNRSYANFLTRTDEDKAIDAMGYGIGRDEDGFRFIREW